MKRAIVDLVASASYHEGFTIRLELFIQEMRREKWCCFSERISNLLTIANCYLYCKTNNEDNEVLWGYFVVTTKVPHTCRSYSSFWMIKTLKDGANYATSTFPIMHLISPPKFCITICDFQSGMKIIFSLRDIRMKFCTRMRISLRMKIGMT